MRNDLPNENASNFSARIRETLMTYLGKQGDPLDRGITLRDLVQSGIASLADLRLARGSGPVPLIPGDAVEGVYEVDLTPPPTPTGFAVDAAITSLFVTHDLPTYTQGHGHLRTRVYGVIRESGDPLPVFADATEIAQFSGQVYAHATTPATTWHLWIKWETVDGVLSANPAGGINGLVAITGQDVSLLLEALNGQITESQLYADLGSRIDLIDAGAAVAGSVANRISAVQDLIESRIDSVQAQVNDLIDTPDYAAGTTYAVDDLVVYNGGIYRAKQTTTGNLPTNTTYWELIGNYSSLGQAVAAHATQISTLTTDLSAEVAARTSLAAGVNDPTTGLAATRSTLVTNYYTKTATDSAISAAATTLTSTFNNTLTGYTPTATLTQDYYTKTQANSAISAATTGLVSTTALNTALGNYTTTANLTSQYYTKTAVDSAISNATLNLVSTTGLNTALAGYATTGSLAAYATTASLTTNYYTKTATDSAISNATLNLVSTTALNTALGGYTPTATLTQNYYTKAQADSAISTATQSLVSTTALNTALGSYTPTATLTQNYYTKTQADSAISSATQSLVSTTALNNALGSYTPTATLTTNYYTRAQTDSAISSSATTLTSQFSNALTGYATTAAVQQSYYTKASGQGLEGQYTVKVDLNGYVSGFGLASTANNAAASSNFAVRADTFYVANPTGPGIAPAMPFIVRTSATTIGGVSVPAGVYITEAFIQNGTISNAKIASAAIDDAKIANLNASKITAGTIAADRLDANTITSKVLTVDAAKITSGTIDVARLGTATIGSAQIANTLQSTNYSSTAGWQINKAGNVVFNQVALRGTINGGSYTGYAWPSSGTGFHLGPDGLLIGNYNTGKYFQVTAAGDMYTPKFNMVNGQLSFTGTVIDNSNIYNESVNIFQLARGASLPDYVRTYKGATTPTVTVNSWLALQMDSSSLNNKIGANDYDAYRTLLPAGTYFYELSVPVKCQGSDTNDACYTAIISNPPGTPSGTTQTVCGYVTVGSGKDSYTEYQCWQEFVPTTYTVLSTAGVNVIGDWQTATIFGVGRFTLTTPAYISAAVRTTDGFPTLNVVARNGYSTTILRIWRDGNA